MVCFSVERCFTESDIVTEQLMVTSSLNNNLH